MAEPSITPSSRSKEGRRSSALQIFSHVDWKTLGLAGLIYGGWLGATYGGSIVPWPLRIAIGGWLAAWHSSLQHEIIHGHPTPWRRVNTALAVWPLSLWLPYPIYRDSHLAHHRAQTLTLPGIDPETHYRRPPRSRLGPFVAVARFGATECAAIVRTPGRCSIWLAHAALVSLVLAWVVLVCRISVSDYLLAFVYPGAALTLLRSFVEHRADAETARRVAVVERAPLLGLLFLHNNLHALHHQRPDLAWHKLPGEYRRRREALLQANGGLVYRGYAEVFARFLLRPHDGLLHPAFRERGSAR
jgi:fatty acid desaturase